MLGALYAEAPNFTVEELGSITVPVLIPGTGHFAPFARPEEFNRNVLTFLAGGAIATPTT